MMALLAGAVRRLGLDPVDGHLYLFFNKRRRLAKALWFDGSGWCVLAKRLSRDHISRSVSIPYPHFFYEILRYHPRRAAVKSIPAGRVSRTV